MIDKTKIFDQVVKQCSFISKDSGGGILNLGMLADGSSAMIKIEPVTMQTSDRQSIVVAYDVTLEAILRQVRDYHSVAAFNGKRTSVLFDDWQKVIDEAAVNPANEENFYPLIKDIEISTIIDVTGENANIKISGKKRIEHIEGNAFVFTNQQIIDMVEDYQVTFNVTAPTTVSITLAGSNGQINWGDGNVENLTPQQKTYSHTYANAGSFTITQAHELTYLKCNTAEVSGDIAQISGLTGLTYLSFSDTSVSGDISAVSGLTGLTVLNLSNTSVSGDISAVSGLTGLTVLYLDNTSVSGDISAVSGLTGLTGLNFCCTSVSGDISAVSGLTNLTKLHLYNSNVSSYTHTALPPWDSCDIQIQDLGLSEDNVEQFIKDLDDAGGRHGSLNIAGSNGEVCDQTAQDAITSLQNKGWTVTYNQCSQ